MDSGSYSDGIGGKSGGSDQVLNSKCRGILIWCHAPVMPALEKPREKSEFEASLTCTVRTSLRMKRRTERKRRKDGKDRNTEVLWLSVSALIWNMIWKAAAVHSESRHQEPRALE